MSTLGLAVLIAANKKVIVPGLLDVYNSLGLINGDERMAFQEDYVKPFFSLTDAFENELVAGFETLFNKDLDKDGKIQKLGEVIDDVIPKVFDKVFDEEAKPKVKQTFISDAVMDLPGEAMNKALGKEVKIKKSDMPPPFNPKDDPIGLGFPPEFNPREQDDIILKALGGLDNVN